MAQGCARRRSAPHWSRPMNNRMTAKVRDRHLIACKAAMEPADDRPDDLDDAVLEPARRQAAMEPADDRPDDQRHRPLRVRQRQAAMEPADDRPDDAAMNSLVRRRVSPQWSRPMIGRMTLLISTFIS